MVSSRFTELASTPLALLLFAALAAAISWFIFRSARGRSYLPPAARGAIFSILVLGFLPVLLNWNSFRGYSLHVDVLDVGGYPADDARLIAPIGNLNKSEVGWEWEIPVISRFATSRTTLEGSIDAQGLTGATQVIFGKIHTGFVVIQLDDDRAPTVRGFVVDPSGVTVDDAVVAISDHQNEAVTTQLGGRFVLPAHASRNAFVWVHAQAFGLPFGTEWLKVGGPPGLIILGQKPKDEK